MKYSVKSSTYTLLMASLLIFPASSVIADQSNNDAVHQLNSHWDKVVGETNPDHRQKLMRDHEEMMDKYTSNASHDSHHVDMMNTIDLHKSMMGLMK